MRTSVTNKNTKTESTEEGKKKGTLNDLDLVITTTTEFTNKQTCVGGIEFEQLRTSDDVYTETTARNLQAG